MRPSSATRKATISRPFHLEHDCPDDQGNVGDVEVALRSEALDEEAAEDEQRGGHADERAEAQPSEPVGARHDGDERGDRPEHHEPRAADQSLGTGHGRREDSPAQYVSFERATSAPAEVVTLYYDSYPSLLARGVIREPVPVAPLPRPFPGFTPDPRG